MPLAKMTKNKILIVEDDPDVAEVLGHYFQFNNIKFDTSKSADDALKKLEQDIYELVLSDIRMPEKDGLELLKQIRASYGLEQKVILMSAHAEYTLEEIYDFGAQGFIQKPFENRYIDLFMKEMRKSANGLFDKKHEAEKPLLNIQAVEFQSDAEKGTGKADLLFGCGGYCVRLPQAFEYTLADIFPFQIDFMNEKNLPSLKGQAIVRWTDGRGGHYFLGAEIIYVEEAGRKAWASWVASEKTGCFIPGRKKLG